MGIDKVEGNGVGGGVINPDTDRSRREQEARQRGFDRRATDVISFLSSDNEETRKKGAEDGTRLVDDMVNQNAMSRAEAEQWLRSKIEQAGNEQEGGIGKMAA